MLKTFVIFLELTIFVASTLSLDLLPDSWKKDVFNIHRHLAVETREIAHTPVTPENVTYYLFTKENPKEFVQFTPDNITVLAQTNRKIVFFIHGWASSRETDWYENLKNAFLATYGNTYSVVQVDWKDAAGQFYYVSSINTYDVAKIVAELILNLNKKYNIKLDDILLVGHSLGGQTAGLIGKIIEKETHQKLPRIVALDPAGPLFDTRPKDKRLNEDDAQIVEVIHSDGGTFGFLKSCGTIDFFPNGGSSQPGCKRIDLADITSVVEPVSCDHGRAAEYFVEAVLNPGELTAKKCESWKQFLLNQCEGESVALGDLTTNATGNFFFETNKDKPYSRSSKSQSGFGINKVISLLKPSFL